jgi:DNA-binding transcriptional ArsR family regulator
VVTYQNGRRARGGGLGSHRIDGRRARGGGLGPHRIDGFTALSDPTRRAIFEQLAYGPRAVGELAEGFPVSRPAVSQHLKVLKEAGLVVDLRDGNRRIYQVDPRGVDAMRAYFDSFWSDALGAFRQAAERKGEQ